MSPSATLEDPILAIYPVPGELDPGTDKIAPLAPIPTRLPRDEAEKAVKRGAFSYVDATYEERRAAAEAARPVAVAAATATSGKGPTKADLEALVGAAVEKAMEAPTARIAELERQLAEATAETPADPGK